MFGYKDLWVWVYCQVRFVRVYAWKIQQSIFVHETVFGNEVQETLPREVEIM